MAIHLSNWYSLSTVSFAKFKNARKPSPETSIHIHSHSVFLTIPGRFQLKINSVMIVSLTSSTNCLPPCLIAIKHPHQRILTILDYHPHLLDPLAMSPTIPPSESTYSEIYKNRRLQELGDLAASEGSNCQDSPFILYPKEEFNDFAPREQSIRLYLMSLHLTA